MTYRERREAKVEHLREWAAKREARFNQDSQLSHQLIDGIPAGQPILSGHHSERSDRSRRSRSVAAFERSLEHQAKAEDFRGRASGIESQLESSIFSDDNDAIEQLQARLTELETQRDRIKAYNASCRKGEPDLNLLDEAQQQEYQEATQFSFHSIGKKGEFHSWGLSNLTGNIGRNRKRLADLVEARRSTESASVTVGEEEYEGVAL